ncbi:MAG: glutathione S-transferase family protein [Pseudomonadota bacterium]
MLFYDTPDPAPNPRRVRLFAKAKGITLPTETISIQAGEHKGEAYRAVNPLGQTPALVLDDGRVLTESVAICRYLDAVHPEPPLFGRDPAEIGFVDMWIRRVELRLMTPVAMVWQHTHPFTARVVVPQYKEFGESQRARAVNALREFDAALADRDWLVGDAPTMADIVLLSVIDFAGFIGLPLPEDASALRVWHARATERLA